MKNFNNTISYVFLTFFYFVILWMLLKTPSGKVSTLRKYAIIASLIFAIPSSFWTNSLLISVSSKKWVNLFLNITPSQYIVLGFFASVINANLITEYLRICIPSGESWDDKKHYRVVGAFWILLFVTQTFGIYLWRRNLGKLLF